MNFAARALLLCVLGASPLLAQGTEPTADVAASERRARALELELDLASGARADQLRGEIRATLAPAVASLGAPIAALRGIARSERSEPDQRRLLELLLQQGELSLRQAKVESAPDETLAHSQAAFDALAAESEAGSPWNYRARLGLADVALARGRFREAADGYEAVIDAAIPLDAALWRRFAKGLKSDEKQSRFVLVQLGTPGLLEALVGAGAAPEAATWGLHFVDTWRHEGLALTAPIGDLALLAFARTLIDVGGWIGGDLTAGGGRWFATKSDALAATPKSIGEPRAALDLALWIAQQVARESSGNVLELRARALIAEIAARPDARVEPAVLLESAKVSFDDGDYSGAIDVLRGVLQRLDSSDQAARQALMAQTLWYLGRSYQKLDRLLEAAQAHERALDEWRGDTQYDQRNARALFEAAQALRRQVDGDPALDALFAKAEKLVTQTGGAFGAEVAYGQAQRLFERGEFEAAKQAFAAVDPAAESYEKALVGVGLCDFELQRYDDASAVFERYLGPFLRDPEQATDDPRRLAKRAEASASAVFHRGLCAAALAARGQAGWGLVIEWLDGFQQRFPGQVSFAPAALFRVIEANVKLGRDARARELLDVAARDFQGSPWTGRAAKVVYDMLAARRADERDPPARKELLRGMADSLHLLDQTARSPSFDNLRLESKHWLELGAWTQAETVLRRTQQLFADSGVAEEARGVREYVNPDLGEALLAQHRVAEAAELLKPLIDAPGATRRTTRNFARALAGWAEYVPSDGGAPGRIEQVPGVGGAENLARATELLDRLAESAPRWTADWYESKFDLAFALAQWGRIDGQKRALAQRQIAFIEQELGARFEHESMPAALARKFVWLAGELK